MYSKEYAKMKKYDIIVHYTKKFGKVLIYLHEMMNHRDFDLVFKHKEGIKVLNFKKIY